MECRGVDADQLFVQKARDGPSNPTLLSTANIRIEFHNYSSDPHVPQVDRGSLGRLLRVEICFQTLEDSQVTDAGTHREQVPGTWGRAHE